MGLFDDFKYKENYQNEEKVIEALKKILRAIHLKNYRDILDCVDGSEVDDVKELLEYIDESLQLNDFDKIDEYGVECNFHPNDEYSQLQVYEWNNIKTKDFPLFREDCFFTGDTVSPNR